MFRRPSDVAIGDYIRAVSAPMARRLEVDYDATFFTSPASDTDVAFYAYRVGLSLLMAYTYPDGWTQTDRAPSAREAKRSAKRVRAALLGPRGPDAVAAMAEGYVRETAQLWSRTAGSAESENETRRIIESAQRARALSGLLAESWRVETEHVRGRVAMAESERYFDPDNPGALIDLQAYVGRARAHSIAVLLLVGEHADAEVAAMLSHVRRFDMGFDVGVLADWNFEGVHLINLLDDERLSYRDIARIQNSAAEADEGR